jgi:hypothetical protein
MSLLLTTGSVLMCAHGGHATPVALATRVLVGGQAALAQPAPLLVAGCANPSPPAGTGPCVTAQFVSGTTRVRSSGLPLLVDSGPSICTPTGTPLTVVATQPRVRAQ